jgi:hypothetical protein
MKGYFRELKKWKRIRKEAELENNNLKRCAAQIALYNLYNEIKRFKLERDNG